MRRLGALCTALPLLVAWNQATAAKPRLSGTITVFAAASLTEAFTKLGTQFEKEHSGVRVKFNFAASSELATQIQQGAPADVFASADEANLQKVVDSGDITDQRHVFARNRLELVVEKGNPKKIKTLADLAKPNLVVVLCGNAVPCGKLARQALDHAGVTVKPASREDNVKAVLTKVELGEADAGLVYVTDVKAAKKAVTGVRIPDAQNVTASYPIAVVKGSRNTAAKAWVLFVRSKQGRKTLREFGFVAP